jgi:hypothetical protein
LESAFSFSVIASLSLARSPQNHLVRGIPGILAMIFDKEWKDVDDRAVDLRCHDSQRNCSMPHPNKPKHFAIHGSFSNARRETKFFAACALPLKILFRP